MLVVESYAGGTGGNSFNLSPGSQRGSKWLKAESIIRAAPLYSPPKSRCSSERAPSNPGRLLGMGARVSDLRCQGCDPSEGALPGLCSRLRNLQHGRQDVRIAFVKRKAGGIAPLPDRLVPKRAVQLEVRERLQTDRSGGGDGASE